jgi:hypothetical protein
MHERCFDCTPCRVRDHKVETRSIERAAVLGPLSYHPNSVGPLRRRPSLPGGPEARRFPSQLVGRRGASPGEQVRALALGRLERYRPNFQMLVPSG